MSKNKKRKEEKKISQGFQTELIGLLIALLAIVGLCGHEVFGTFGNLVLGFFMFIGGSNATYIAILFLMLGVYIMVTRDKPNLFSTRLIGLYIFLIGFLTLSHSGYFKTLTGAKILTETFNNLSAAVSSNGSIAISGGGIIGALFSCLLVWLFKGAETKLGIYIVVWVLIVTGMGLFSGFTIFDIIKSLKDNASKALSKKKGKPVENATSLTKEQEAMLVHKVESMKNIEDNEPEKQVYNNIDDIINKDKEKENQSYDIPVEDDTEEDESYIDNSNYELPPLSVLDKVKKQGSGMDTQQLHDKVKQIQEALLHYDIRAKVVDVHTGPAVTQYELEVEHGIKLSKITNISRELALELSAKSVNIQAPIPGKNTVGIELPNAKSVSVSFREVFERMPQKLQNSKLAVVLGKDIMGEPQFLEINKTPHLLVAGATGSGKSVCINGIISSLLMRTKPDEVKLVLVDPKKVEFSVYQGDPHLLVPVVTDCKKANIALKKIVVEMDRRYEEFESNGVKKIEEYNELMEKKNANLPDDEKKRKMCYIVVIIDELADLMTLARKEVEESILRITQLARAAGIHLIVATQRPSTDVITGVIKSNIPSRIAFAVSSQIDSRTILDHAGAEKLLGKGDMLSSITGSLVPTRIQGCYISDDEIKRIVDHCVHQQLANYDMRFTLADEDEGATSMVETDEHDAGEEPMYNDVVKFVVEQKKASASLIQRRFRMGYNRAARCMDLLEERGIVGPQNGSKPREILVDLKQDNEEDE